MNHNYFVIPWHRAAKSTATEFFSLGPTPHEEACTQAGHDYTKDGEFECAVLIDQMIRIHGAPPQYAEFFICKNEHESGIYHEAAIRYKLPNDNKDYDDMSDWEQEEYDKAYQSELYAMKMETGIPDKWDEIALKQLKESGHALYAPKEPAKVVKHQGKVIKIKSETA